jgi:YHS domain-containing protein
MQFAAGRHPYSTLLWVKDSSHCCPGFVPGGNGTLLGNLWLASHQGARLYTMIVTKKPLLFGEPNFLLDDEQKIIAHLTQTAAITGVQIEPTFVTHFYVTLKTERLAILAGPPHSGKSIWVQSLARYLTGGHPLQCQMMGGHAWWASRSGNVGFFTQLQMRLNSAKILAMAEEVLRPKNARRIFIGGLIHISQAEVNELFSDLAFQIQQGRLSCLPDIHLTRSIPYPPNLFLIGTMDTMLPDLAYANLSLRLKVIHWPGYGANLASSKIISESYISDERRLTLRAKDPVCGMEVEEKKAAGTSEYQGKTYYFCSLGCKKTFDKEPQKYVGKTPTQSSHH